MRRVDDSLKGDRDAVLLAVANHGLGFADESLEGDSDFVLATVAVVKKWVLCQRERHVILAAVARDECILGTPPAASSATAAASAAVGKNGLASASGAATRKRELHRIIPTTGDTGAAISKGPFVEGTPRAVFSRRAQAAKTNSLYDDGTFFL